MQRTGTWRKQECRLARKGAWPPPFLKMPARLEIGCVGFPSRLFRSAGACALFVTQGDDGIDAHGAARGDVTRQQRNREQQNDHTAKGEWIGRADVIKEASHPSR